MSTTIALEAGLTCDEASCGTEFLIGEEFLWWYGRKLHPQCANADANRRREESGEDGDVLAAARAQLAAGTRVILTRRQIRGLIALALTAGLQPVRRPDTGRQQWYGRMQGWSSDRVRGGLSAAEVAGLWSDFLEVGRMPPLRACDLAVIIEQIDSLDLPEIVTSPLPAALPHP